MTNQLSFDQMTWSINPCVDQMTFGEMPVGQMAVGENKWHHFHSWHSRRLERHERGEVEGASGVSICDADREN